MNDAVQSVKPPKGDRRLTQDPNRLRWRRHAAGLTITELAEKAEVSRGAISMAENRRMNASVVMLRKLAGALGCQITDLMPDEPRGDAA